MTEREEIRRLAAEVGLEKLAEAHPGEIGKALAAARRLKSDMPRDFALSDEPAHVFHADIFRTGEEA